MSDAKQVVIAVTRQVKRGREREFEAALQEFFSGTASEGSSEGQFFIRPATADGNRYGILRSFESTAARDNFYKSEIFNKWQDTVQPLVEGEAFRRELHGLEAFFPTEKHPPRWKMAIVTWLGVFPMVVLWSGLLRPVTSQMHPIAATALVTALVVPSLVWLVMPGLTKVFAAWLRGRSS